MEEAQRWVQDGAGAGMPLRGLHFAAPLSSASCGILALVRDDAPVNDVRAGAAPEGGRVLELVLSYAGQELSVVGCYAPDRRSQRAAFMEQVLGPALPRGRPCLLGGDWNLVTDARDVFGAANLEARAAGGEQLGALMTELGLVDAWRLLHPHDRGFTHLATNGASAARIDRWYVPGALAGWVRRCEHVHGWPGDHLAVGLTLAPPATIPSGPGRFRLPLSMLNRPEFCEAVVAATRQFLAQHPVQASYSAAQRWGELKAALTRLCLARTLAARRAATAERRRLRQATEAAHTSYVAAPQLPARAAAYQQAVRQLQLHEEAVAAETAAAADLLLHGYGERPTYWFHLRYGPPLRPHAPLVGVLDPADASLPAADMCTAAGRALAADRAVRFFSSDSPVGLFRPAQTDPAAQQTLLAAVDRTLSPSEAAAALGPEGTGKITDQEVLSVLPRLPRGASPGLDGLPYEFYARFWADLGPAFLAMLDEVFGGASEAQLAAQPGLPVLPPSMQQGLLALLPKGGTRDPRSLASWRPITLLNTDHRILSRVLFERYAGPLAAVIDLTQSAFLPGRWIGDNVLYHAELLDYLQRTGLPACIVSLDSEKAYDRCVREWIFLCMGRMGFPEPAVRWVRILLAGTTARVSLNGHYTPAFPVRCSVQQGSALSCLLYILTLQPLSALLRRECERHCRTAARHRP